MPGVIIQIDPNKKRPNGKPLYQDGKHRYRARWWNAHESGLKPVYKVFRTKTLARRWISDMDAQAKYEFDHPEPPVERTMTFGQLVDAWRGTRLAYQSPRTQTRYDQILRNYLLPAWGEERLVDLTREAVKRYFAKLAESKQPPTYVDGQKNPRRGKPMTAGTLRKVQVVASSVFSEGMDLGYCRTNPASKLRLPDLYDGDHSDEMLFLNGSEVEALARAIDAPSELDARTPFSYRVAVLTAAYTGLRASELWALRRMDVDTKKGRIYVRRALKRTHGQGKPTDAPEFGKPKNAEERIVSIPPFLRDELAAHLATLPHTGNREADRATLVFTAPEGGTVRHELFMRRRFKPAVRRSLPHKAQLRFHDLRHSAASLAIHAGATPQQVSDRLGHKDTRTTKRYSHLYEGHDDALLAALEKTHARASESKRHLKAVS